MFTDTDCLNYEINDDNDSVYKKCFKDKHCSGYPKESNYHDVLNKKVLVKMKYEFNGVKINQFIGLKSKMYSLISVDDKEVNKAKGIYKKLKHKEYLDFLFGKKVVRHGMKRMQSKLHEIGT